MAENALVRLFGREAATRRRNELAANFAPDPTPIRNRIADHRAQVDATLGGTTLQNRLAMLGSTGVPVLSDVAGLAADAMGYAGDPSSRTPVNYGLSALGLLPFVPGMTATKGVSLDWTPGGGGKVAQIGDTEITYGVSKNGVVDLILIKTPKAKRGAGSARAALRQFLSEADSQGFRVALDAEPMDKGISKSRLEDFYKSEGFRKNSGRRRDFDTRAGMIRDPILPEGKN